MLSVLSRLDPSALLTGSLPLIGDDAAHKVRVGGPQVGHQLVQILLGVDESWRSGTTGATPLVPETWAPNSLLPEPSQGQGADT